MIVGVSLTTEYIPDWNGNKQDEKPIVVEHLKPSMKLRERLIPKPRLKFNFGTDGKSEGGETDMVLDTRKIVEEMTTSIRNLELRDEATGKVFLTVTSARDLYSSDSPPILAALADELGVYYQRLLAENVDTKN